MSHATYESENCSADGAPGAPTLPVVEQRPEPNRRDHFQADLGKLSVAPELAGFWGILGHAGRLCSECRNLARSSQIQGP
jgi:hypothetical protein